MFVDGYFCVACLGCFGCGIVGGIVVCGLFVGVVILYYLFWGMFVYLLLYTCSVCGVSLYFFVLIRRWCALGWFTICCFVIVSTVIGDCVCMLFAFVDYVTCGCACDCLRTGVVGRGL